MEFPQRIRLSVSQKNIDEGTQGLCHACPVALALEDRGWQARVDAFVVQLYDPKGGYAEYRPSERLSQFIFTFDDVTGEGLPVVPSTFVIERINRDWTRIDLEGAWNGI